MVRRIGTGELALAGLRKSWRRLTVEFGAPLRAVKLSKLQTSEFASLPASLNLGDVDRGLQLLDGRMEFGSQSLDVGTQGDPWSIPAPSKIYARRLHSFDWLDDLTSVALSKSLARKNPALCKRAGEKSRHLVDRWIDIYGKWNPYAWRGDILTSRIFAWLNNWQALLDDDDLERATARRTSLVRQLKWLRKTYGRTPDGLSRLKAAACLVIGGACLEGKQEVLLNHGLDVLDDEIDKQIFADGGHIGRSPAHVRAALCILIRTEAALDARGITGSKEIRRAIDRLAPMVMFFTAPDGKGFGFNGAGTGDPRRTKALLKFANIEAKAFGYAPHTKFHRLTRNDTVVMIDVGDAPARPYDLEAHLAPLAIEMSTACGPMIVNCGWNRNQPQHWRQSMRSTVAHSTLVLDNHDTGKLLAPGIKANLLGTAIAQDAGGVQCSRNNQESGTWLEASHNGYLKTYGLCHRRRLYMDMTGTDIRGEDQLFLPLGREPLRRDQIAFALRFHLHPDVKVTLSQNGHSALLILQDGGGWRFRADTREDGGPLKLEKSIYLADGCKPRPSEQLVIYGQAYGDSDGQTKSNRVRWTLKRMDSASTRARPKQS
ncbi:MAG: hypothetical protein COA91_10055 [Robiginitomaculum sp.]|nr:MAG: hypothetical protein COA91_10055 [Robiginitomaculum sp.]